jgi:hypothetical protein
MRIVWTKEEKRALRESMIDFCYVTPTMSNKGLLQNAQLDVIPHDRRTKITDQRVFNYKALINEARAAAEQHRAKERKPVPQPVQPAAVVAAEPAPKPDALVEMFNTLLDALADRVIARMQRQQEEKHDDAADAWRHMPAFDMRKMLDNLTVRPKIVIKRPTALVIGLNGAQMESVKQARPEVDFTFVTAEQAVSHNTLSKDHTILMTKFINHSVQGRYRKHLNLHFCNGGVSELKTLLHGIFYVKRQTAQ